MELYNALKIIVENEGRGILNEVRLLNILSDYKAFEKIPASKVILKMLITDGYMHRLIENNEWNQQCSIICQQFVSSSGFQEDYVKYVLEGISFALGWNSFDRNLGDLSIEVPKRRTLADITGIDENSVIEKVITISNVFVEYYGKKCIHLTFEVSKEHDSIVNIYVVIFDKKGRIRKKEGIDSIWNNEHHRFMEKYCDLPVPRTNVSKVLITAY